MKSIFTTIFATFMLLLVSCNSNGQNAKKATVKNSSTTGIQVIQFHSENRCVTCNLIEKLTKETVKKHSSISFKSINVDEKKNQKIAEEFEATGTALFLYNPKTGAKKDLTDFAFMNAKSKPEEFKKGLEQEIKAFK